MQEEIYSLYFKTNLWKCLNCYNDVDSNRRKTIMTVFGVSVYPDLSPMSEINEYLHLASKYGFTRVFSSMFSVEGTNEEIIDYFREFIKCAHECGMRVSLDVNTSFLTRLGQSYDDISLFHEIGCDIIRLDGSYGVEKDIIMTRNPYGIQVEMNASSSGAREIAYFKEHGVPEDRVLVCHNFYPQRYTGLKWNNFLETNRKLRPYGYRMAAFVSSNNKNTHGVWDARDGLPTVERMRGLPIDLQVRIMLATGDVDDILIGNAYASEAEFQAIAEVMKPARPIEDSPIYKRLQAYGSDLSRFKECKRLKVIPEPDITDIERGNLFDLIPQADYGDSSEWIWRSRMGRMVNADRPIPPKHYDGETFPAGSVVVVNDNYRHYSGELQIVKIPIANDGQRNLIGHLAPGEMMMLELINDGDIVEFMEYQGY